MSTMRAAVFSEFGGPEVVGMGDLPIPEPGPGEVRVRVRAAAMNHLDLWIRRGLPLEITMPHIGGSDVAGMVDAVAAITPVLSMVHLAAAHRVVASMCA